MKITKMQQPAKRFEPIRLVFNLLTKEEALAFFAISRWDITIPENAITSVGATRRDVHAMIKRFQKEIEPYSLVPEAVPLPRVEVTFEAQHEVDQARLYEKIPGLADALAEKPQPWKVGDTVYLRGFYPKRMIVHAPERMYDRYQIVDSETGDVQSGPHSAAYMTGMFSSLTGMYTHEVQKRYPRIGDTLYNFGMGSFERRIVACGGGAKIANLDGSGHHYTDIVTLKGIEELIDQGIYTYESK